MGMFHSTSGKYGFEPHIVNTRARLSKEELKKIMMEEDRLRASKEIQEAYSQALKSYEVWNNIDQYLAESGGASQASVVNQQMESVLEKLAIITTELQERAIKEFIPLDKIRALGMTQYLRALRNARFQYVNDDEMNQLTVYQRHDKSERGNHGIGLDAPNITLLDIDAMGESKGIDVLSLQEGGKPLILICGSIS